MNLQSRPVLWSFFDVAWRPLYTRDSTNIVFVSIFLNVGFDLVFSRKSVRITLHNILHGFGLHYDSFTILDCNPSTYEYYVDCCIMTCYSINNDINVITWHAILGHIR